MKKLLANENFPLDSVYLLEKWGYDVYSVSNKILALRMKWSCKLPLMRIEQ
jgi:hypothetical protein